MWSHQGGESCAESGVCHCPDAVCIGHNGARRERRQPRIRRSSEPRAPCVDIIKAVILGVVEGLTEYLPVSSTGHLLLVRAFLRLRRRGLRQHLRDPDPVRRDPGAAVDLLQRGCRQLAIGFFTDATARRFVLGVLLAFLPAAVRRRAAARLHQDACCSIRGSCASSLIVGGVVLMWVDEPRPQAAPPRRDRRSRCRCISRSASASASP